VTSEIEARQHVRSILDSAVDAFGGSLDDDREEVGEIIRCARIAQGNDMPAALDEYLRAAGSDSGLGSKFPRGQSVTARGCLDSRMIAIETALLSGSDWQMFRFAEPLVVFDSWPGGEVFWVEFDADDSQADHDPPVWMLSEKPGSGPTQVAKSFSAFIAASIDLEVETRKKYGA